MNPLADRARLLRILETALRLPTAPFAEHAVLEEIDRFARSRPALALESDRFGNRLIFYRKGPQRPTLAFAAHVDHPGFVFDGVRRGVEGRARFYGGGGLATVLGNDGRVGVRFFAKDGDRFVEHRARIVGSRKDSRKGAAVTLRFDSPPKDLPPGTPGMWDLTRFSVRGQRVYGRALDDLAGVASMIALLDHLCLHKPNAHVACLFTRAEEVGFVGAVAALGPRGVLGKRLAQDAPIISLEASQSRPGALIGRGPVLRVGDRASVFDPAITAYLERVAEGMGEGKGRFVFQRQLMGGGSCEATAFQAFGRPTGALCVPLGNYHNIKPNWAIGPEFIGLDDLGGMADWMIAASLQTRRLGRPDRTVRHRLDRRLKDWRELLEESV